MAAVGLLGAAMVLGHVAALQALLMVSPSAAFAKFGMSGGAEGPHSASSLLHLAAEHGSSSAARARMVVAPGLTTRRDERAWVPLHFAAVEGHQAVVQQLLAVAPQAGMLADQRGWLPLHVAAENGHVLVVQLLDAAPQAATVQTQNGTAAVSWGPQWAPRSG